MAVENIYISYPSMRVVGDVAGRTAGGKATLTLYDRGDLRVYFVDDVLRVPIALPAGALVSFGAKEMGRWDGRWVMYENSFSEGVDDDDCVIYEAPLTSDTAELRALLGASVAGISDDDCDFIELSGAVRVVLGGLDRTSAGFSVVVHNSLFHDGTAGPDDPVVSLAYPDAEDLDSCQVFNMDSGVANVAELAKPHRYTVRHLAKAVLAAEDPVYTVVLNLPTAVGDLSEGNTIAILVQWPDAGTVAGYQAEIYNGTGGALLKTLTADGVQAFVSEECTYCGGGWEVTGLVGAPGATGATGAAGAAGAPGADYAPTIVAKAGTSEMLEATDVGDYVRLTNVAAKTYTVPLNATVAIAVEDVVTVRNVGAGLATITPESGGVTINAGELTVEQNQTVQILKVATDEWDLIG